jgi:hypothetical protein
MLNRLSNRNVTFDEFIRAAKRGYEADLRTVNLYIEQNHNNVAAINATDRYGNTALIWAARHGHIAIVRALLAKEGIAINTVGQDGDTALIWAAHNGNAANVTALLARLNLEAITHKNNEHCTAAQEAEQRGHDESAKLITARERKLRLALPNVVAKLELPEMAEEKVQAPDEPCEDISLSPPSSLSVMSSSSVSTRASESTARMTIAEKRFQFFAPKVLLQSLHNISSSEQHPATTRSRVLSQRRSVAE